MITGEAYQPEAVKSDGYLPLDFALHNSGFTLDLNKTFKEDRKLFLYDQGIVMCFSSSMPH